MLVAGPFAVTTAWASPVKGTVVLPTSLKATRRYQGYWRVENGSVPIAPPATHNDVVVVLSGLHGTAPPARTVTVELSGLLAAPTALVIGPGSVVEFKNSDRVPHDLYVPGQDALMPVQRVAPGGLRLQKFLAPGGYEVRCALYPHIAINVIVVDTPFWAALDDRGAFRIADAPDGKATLKVWTQGRWVHEEPVEVRAGAADLQIHVDDSVGKETGE